jgi:hypothetical protein
MRKRLAGVAAVTAAAAVALVLPMAGTSAPPDFTGKPCMNIFLTASYTSATATPGETAVLAGTLTTPSAPSCAGAVYTVNVQYVDTNGVSHSETFSFIGNGSTDAFSYSLTIQDAPSGICVYGTSQPNSKSSSFGDIAPNAGCTASSPDVTLSTSGGASGFG